MIAGAQVVDSAWKLLLTDTALITGSGLFVYADTSYVDVTDTVRSQMLVVDTCKDGPVLFINGYVIRKYRKYGNNLWTMTDYPKTVGILDRNKKLFGKCFCILELY